MDKKYIVVLLITFISFGIQAAEKERIVKKNVKVNEGTELVVKNVFGDVKVESYNGSEIDIEVVVWARGSSESKVNKFVDDIDVDISTSRGEVRVESTVGSNNGKVKEFKVNVNVRVPINSPLTIKNSFGNVYISEHKGAVNLDVSHGDFELGKVVNSGNEIELQFGDGEIEEYGGGEIELSHSNLKISKAHEIYLESQFSNTKVETVNGDIKASISHGEFDVSDLVTNYRTIDVKATFSTVELNLDEKNPFEIEYKGSFSTFKRPKGIEIIEHKEEINSEFIRAKYNGGGAEVNVKVSFSTFRIK